ncbi:MAG: hypothetical protein ABSB59_11910 [Streptosporangiaceae bacterium]
MTSGTGAGEVAIRWVSKMPVRPPPGSRLVEQRQAGQARDPLIGGEIRRRPRRPEGLEAQFLFGLLGRWHTGYARSTRAR